VGAGEGAAVKVRLVLVSPWPGPTGTKARAQRSALCERACPAAQARPSMELSRSSPLLPLERARMQLSPAPSRSAARLGRPLVGVGIPLLCFSGLPGAPRPLGALNLFIPRATPRLATPAGPEVRTALGITSRAPLTAGQARQLSWPPRVGARPRGAPRLTTRPLRYIALSAPVCPHSLTPRSLPAGQARGWHPPAPVHGLGASHPWRWLPGDSDRLGVSRAHSRGLPGKPAPSSRFPSTWIQVCKPTGQAYSCGSLPSVLGGPSLRVQVSITLRRAQTTGVLPVVSHGVPAAAARVAQHDVGRVHSVVRPSLPGAESDVPRAPGSATPSLAEPVAFEAALSAVHDTDLDK
jgi:hypothetical protein